MRKILAATLAGISISLFVFAATLSGDDRLISATFGLFAFLMFLVLAVDEIEIRR